MVDQSSRFRAIVHVTPTPNGAAPTELILAAYRASRDAAVMLVLESITRAEVDRILDRIVADSGLDMRGVRYTEIDDVDEVLDASNRAPLIFASNSALEAKLTSRGIEYLRANDADSHLVRS